MRRPDELRAAVEGYLDDLTLANELGELAGAVRYALEGGGKRIRPVLCLATADAAGADADAALPAAAALELVHSFSLVHDDLPALDDDDERRGRPTVHVRFGEAQAILAGDALLAEAFRLALQYPSGDVARELALATSAMIGGQYLDVNGAPRDPLELNRLKTGRLFEASVACGLWAAGIPAERHAPWRAFGSEFGLLFQLVDDLFDDDGVVRERGREAVLGLARETEEQAFARLEEVDGDPAVLRELLGELAGRAQQFSV